MLRDEKVNHDDEWATADRGVHDVVMWIEEFQEGFD